MTAVRLYQYVQMNNIEWHYEDNCGVIDVILLPPIYHLEEFNKLLSPGCFDDDGIPCIMKDGYVAIWMRDICEYHDIVLEEIFIE